MPAWQIFLHRVVYYFIWKKKEFLPTFLKSEDISYTMPGTKDQVYIGKDPDGQHMYKPKHCLLWTLREILAMFNEDLFNWNFLLFIVSLRKTRKFIISRRYHSSHAFVKHVKTLNYFVKALNTLKQV